MRIRPVRADELDLFVEVAGYPEHREEVSRYLESMFAAGSMRPEWCFVAQEEGEDHPLGRVAFWTLPGMGETLRPGVTRRPLGWRLRGRGHAPAQGRTERGA